VPVSTDSSEFQFPVSNSGQTPGELLTATGWFVIAGSISSQCDLLQGATLGIFPGIPKELLPRLSWPITSIDLLKLSSSRDNLVVLSLRYKDYAGKERDTTSTFVVHKTNDKFQLTLVHETLK
jgi:hypothetical protein